MILMNNIKFNNSSADKNHQYIEDFTNTLIKSLENNTAPWTQPWKATGLKNNPHNAITEQEYNGCNALLLEIITAEKGYKDPRWLTFKQAKDLGCFVKKGEKGVPIRFVSVIEPKKTDLDKEMEEEGFISLNDDKKYIVKHYTLFNAEQIENMPERKQFEADPNFEFKSIENAEKILANSEAIIEHKLGDRAYYNPSLDKIVLPEKQQFKNEMGYYSVALHELGHWTGHKNRLNRNLEGGFGSEQYAREELRAEIASYMLCKKLNIDFDPSEHLSYINSWKKIINNNPNELYQATKDALKIVEYVSDFSIDKNIKKENAISKNAMDNVLKNVLNKTKGSGIEIAK